jgi:hypothetical protein
MIVRFCAFDFWPLLPPMKIGEHVGAKKEWSSAVGLGTISIQEFFLAHSTALSISLGFIHQKVCFCFFFSFLMFPYVLHALGVMN